MSASREFPEPINKEHIGLAAQVEKRLEPNLPPLLRVHEGERLSRRKSGREEQRGRVQDTRAQAEDEGQTQSTQQQEGRGEIVDTMAG